MADPEETGDVGTGLARQRNSASRPVPQNRKTRTARALPLLVTQVSGIGDPEEIRQGRPVVS